jgi:pimeloyl-ACP methyl ester carboxylesterase
VEFGARGEGLRIKIRGLSLNVEKRGSSVPAIVFLHYWGGTSRTWTRVVAELQGKFTTVAYDARGWGRSDKPPVGYKLTDLADEALSLIEKLGIKTYFLVGHSLGGKISQLIGSRDPEGLKGLVLVAPAPPTPLRLPDEAREIQIHAYENRENVLQAISFLNARTPSPDIVEQIIEDSMSGSREATLAYPTGSILEDISSEVSKISVPTLVLASELDRVDSIEQHKREVVARIRNAQFEIISGSGHLIPIDEPVQLANAIARFVERSWSNN